MNERFLLPIAVATALHAILFFGFGTDGAVALPNEVVAVGSAPPPDTVKVEWTPASDDAEFSPEAGNPSAEVPPETPEPPPRESATFTQIVLPRETAPTAPVVGLTKIPTGPFGPASGGPGPDGPRLVPSSALDNLPRTRAQLAPVYPFEARQDGRHGEVLVEFVVDEEGRVVDPHVMRSNDPIFDAPTLRAVAKWRFEPGRKNGRVVRFRMAVPVAFSVNP